MNLPSIPAGVVATLSIYFPPSVFALCFWSSKSRSEDRSPICGNATTEGWAWLAFLCQRAQMPQRWGGANIMENMQPSIRDISWSGTSSCALAGVLTRTSAQLGRAGVQLLPEWNSQAWHQLFLALHRSGGWEQPSDLAPQSRDPWPAFRRHLWCLSSVPLPPLNERSNSVLASVWASPWWCHHC